MAGHVTEPGRDIGRLGRSLPCCGEIHVGDRDGVADCGQAIAHGERAGRLLGANTAWQGDPRSEPGVLPRSKFGRIKWDLSTVGLCYFRTRIPWRRVVSPGGRAQLCARDWRFGDMAPADEVRPAAIFDHARKLLHTNAER